MLQKNVIQFPARKSGRVIESNRKESHQALMALSLVSLVLVAVFTNEQVLKAQRPVYIISDNSRTENLKDLNRAIASAHPLNPIRDIEWEHQLAKQLEADDEVEGESVTLSRAPASFGRPASSLDQVRFGKLGGKYRISFKSIDGIEKVEAIDYVDSMDSSDRPERFSRAQFLNEYKDSFAVQFDSLEYQGRTGSTEVYSLRDRAQQEVGKAVVKVDEEDHFLALEFTHK
jgi:hypothetical protein